MNHRFKVSRAFGSEPNARLTLADASYHYLSKVGPHLDWVTYWVFDSAPGDDFGSSDMVRYVESRAPQLGQLRRRLFEVPGDIDYPYWVDDDRPLAEGLVHHEGELSWEACLADIGRIAATPLDATVAPWRLHVFYRVRSGTHRRIVVVFVASHALFAGTGISALSESLFGDPPETLSIPGLGPSAARVSTVSAVAVGLARIPVQLCRFALGRMRMSRANGGPEDLSSPAGVAASSFNAPVENDRAIEVIVTAPDSFSRDGATVTEFVLAAISRAVHRYWAEVGEPATADSAAVVTVALGSGREFAGVNTLGSAVVPLHSHVADSGERLRCLRTALRDERDRAAGAAEQRRREVMSVLPSLMYKRGVAGYRARTAARRRAGLADATTVLTSINCGAAARRWTLAGRGFACCGMVPPLTAEIGLVHGVVGAGDSCTITVLSTPTIVPGLRRYREILRAELERPGFEQV